MIAVAAVAAGILRIRCRKRVRWAAVPSQYEKYYRSWSANSPLLQKKIQINKSLELFYSNF
jgi:hypothetical protein